MSSFTKSASFLGLLAAAAQVSAHGFVNKVVADGTEYTGYLVTSYPYQTSPPASVGWTTSATDLGFVAPDAYASGDIICHRNGANAQLSATVAAGGTVEMIWNTWPESHHGPVLDYLASCKGDCATVDKTSLEFFKIAETGLIDNSAAPGVWGSDKLMANNLTWSITIPSTIAPGNYVLRHEMIALHSAGSNGGAQNYPQCVNLKVTGSGTDSPAGTLGESLYTATDPGILVSIYSAGLSYEIPGPAVYSGGSAAAPSAATSAVVATSAATSSVIATSAASSVVVSASAISSVVVPFSSAIPTTFATSFVASAPASTVTSPAEASPTSVPDDECEA